MRDKITVGAYGSNGHQITWMPVERSNCEIVGVCEVSFEGATVYETLDDMLENKDIQLISLCSPNRSLQAEDAIKCMRSGKHVYAEKPCALNEKDLDRILEVSKETGMEFHEMAGTAFSQPFLSMRRLVNAGAIGEVIQVFAQKSYPSNLEFRPQDENIDGGLLRQAGVHALRFIEHITGIKIKDLAAIESKKGNHKNGGLHMASSLMMTLENGGLASAVVNYLNPKEGFKRHGNDQVRIFGDKGFIEAVDDGTKTRLVLNNKDMGVIDTSEKEIDYFGAFILKLLGKGKMPISIEDELHPTRMIIRAKDFADKKSSY